MFILVAVDFVSKLVEALPCRATVAMHLKRMFHEAIFPWYWPTMFHEAIFPRIVISDGGSHCIDRTFWKALMEVGVDHQIIT
jgi:hypothetical protein